MQIEIDNFSGFCYGVTKTIERAESALQQGQPVYCLGEIVHNEEEVKRLKNKGLIIINEDDLKNIDHSKILIRAHGISPSVYHKIIDNSNLAEEGTCPIVLSLQKKIRDSWKAMKKDHGQIIIYGKKGHAEVIGLAGQTNDEAIIISQISELEKVDFSRPMAIFAQTTQNPVSYQAIINEINIRIQKLFPENKASFNVTDSICRHVSKRSEQLKVFAGKHDVIIFVSGTGSSNGKVLFDTCLIHNPNSFWVPNDNEIRKEWFTNMQTVGICGATSTPRWLMEKVAGKIKEITNN